MLIIKAPILGAAKLKLLLTGGQLPVMPRTVGLPTYAAVPDKAPEQALGSKPSFREGIVEGCPPASFGTKHVSGRVEVLTKP